MVASMIQPDTPWNDSSRDSLTAGARTPNKSPEVIKASVCTPNNTGSAVHRVSKRSLLEIHYRHLVAHARLALATIAL